MQDLIKAKGEKTPLIEFHESGELRIEGRSSPENPFEFYQDVLAWVKEYTDTNPAKTSIHIKLDYFNTSTSKLLLNLFRQFEQIHNSGSEIKIYWYHEKEDSDMMEAGQYYEVVTKLPFHYPN
jgi:hypothetical protein